MKVTITNDEVKFLVNMVLMGNKPISVPAELNSDWMSWVIAPVAQHRIAPREAKALLTAVGILADYGISINRIIETILEAFVENYGYFDLKNAIEAEGIEQITNTMVELVGLTGGQDGN